MQHPSLSFWRHSLQLIMGCALVAGFAGTAAAQVNPFEGRIAISADGNAHDRDDIGASPLGLLILEHAGMKGKLVHYGYNSHVWFDGKDGMTAQLRQKQRADMTKSIKDAQSMFGYPSGVFRNIRENPSGAYNHLRDQMRIAANDKVRLYVLVGGPYHHVCEALKQVPANQRDYITIVNHGDSNPLHTHNNPTGCTVPQSAFNSGKFMGARFVDIRNQNGVPNAVNADGFKNPYTLWTPWMTKSRNDKQLENRLKFVHSRMKLSFPDKADVSDAGMVWYMVTGGPARGGQQNGNPKDLEAFFNRNF